MSLTQSDTTWRPLPTYICMFSIYTVLTVTFFDGCVWSIHFPRTTRPETLWQRGKKRHRDQATWTAQRGRNTTQIHMQLATPQSMTSLRLPSRYMIYLVGSRSDVIDCGVELHQGFQATRLPLATKAKMFVHPFCKMFTVGESRPMLVFLRYETSRRSRVKTLIGFVGDTCIFFKCEELS